MLSNLYDNAKDQGKDQVKTTSKSIRKKTLLKLNEGTGYRRVSIYNGVHNQHF